MGVDCHIKPDHSWVIVSGTVKYSAEPQGTYRCWKIGSRTSLKVELQLDLEKLDTTNMAAALRDLCEMIPVPKLRFEED